MPEEMTPREAFSRPFASITCDDIEEQGLADRYALGQLLPEEAEAFEDHYMSCDRCVALVERAQLLTQGFKRLAAEGLIERDLPAKETVGDVGTVAPEPMTESGKRRQDRPPNGVISFEEQRRKRRGAVRQSGALIAAALVGAVLTVPLWTGRTPESPARVELYHLQPERSAGEPIGHQLVAPTKSSAVVLALELSPPFYERYRAVLFRGNQDLWSAEGLTLGERDTVSLFVPPEILEAGTYRLQLEGLTGDHRVDAGHFAFKVAF